MHEASGDPEENRVARAGVGDFAEDVGGVPFAQLKDAPVITLRAEIEAQTDQAIVPRIAVPGIVMTGPGHHPVDPANEATDASAAGQLLHKLEEVLVIGEKMQEIKRDIVCQAQLCPDVIVSPFGEFGCFEPMADETQEILVEQSLETNAVLTSELRAQTFKIVLRRRRQAGSTELHHDRVMPRPGRVLE